jgi:hypothetical protein
VTGGKALFGEEQQSGWGQGGRRRGFVDVAAPSKEVVAEAFKKAAVVIRKIDNLGFDSTLHALQAIRRMVHTDRADDWTRTWDASGLSSEEIATVHKWEELDYLRREHGGDRRRVPIGPFVRDTGEWTRLLIRREIQHAIDGGYDSFIMTTGLAPARRAGQIQPNITRLTLTPNRGDTFQLRGFVQGGLARPRINRTIDSLDDLPAILGDDMAKRLTDAERHGNPWRTELRNLEPMTLGGEGMIRYYDEIWWQNAQKVLRGLDKEAKMTLVDVELLAKFQKTHDNTTPGMRIPITEALRNKVLREGQAKFSGGSRTLGLGSLGLQQDLGLGEQRD